MARYPVDIPRCQHIKTSGAQCGSPALKDKEFCYYHQVNRAVPAEIYLEGETYCDHQMMLPPLEDAHAIQTMLRHVMQLMLQHRIDRKDAGLMLYALQIASGNLKQMLAEKPSPTQVVRDTEKVSETPMGKTPWSAAGTGHDPDLTKEEKAGEEGLDFQRWDPGYHPTAEEMYYGLTVEQRKVMRASFHEKGYLAGWEVEDFVKYGGVDPLLRALNEGCAVRDGKKREKLRKAVKAEEKRAEREQHDRVMKKYADDVAADRRAEAEGSGVRSDGLSSG